MGGVQEMWRRMQHLLLSSGEVYCELSLWPQLLFVELRQAILLSPPHGLLRMSHQHQVQDLLLQGNDELVRFFFRYLSYYSRESYWD